MASIQERFPSLFVKENWCRKNNHVLVHIPTDDKFIWGNVMLSCFDDAPDNYQWYVPKYLKHLNTDEYTILSNWLSEIMGDFDKIIYEQKDKVAQERYK
jgi:hypothetical protein